MRNLSTISALLLCAILAACNSEPVAPPQPTPFQYDNTQSVQLDVTAYAQGQPVKGAPLNVFQGFTSDGTVDENTSILTGVTNASGVYSSTLTLPADLKSIGIKLNYIGLISEPIKLDIVNGKAKLRLDDQQVSTANVIIPESLKHPPTNTRTTRTANYTYKYLGGAGGWNSLGVPTNLTTNSTKVTSDMLSTINATLPEGTPLPLQPVHKKYIANDSSSNLVLQQNAELWMTFVHEGAGYTNSVGYYLYDANNPPTSVSDILGRMIIAYPNASYQGSGGGLTTSKRVQLKYYDTSTQTWSNTFPSGTAVGWFVVSNGWRNSSTGVLERTYEQTVFSDPVINYGLYHSQGMTIAQSAQTVLLVDQNHQTLLLGFEDILRHHGGDQDFNDAILLIEASPFSAIKTTNIVTRDPVDPTSTHTTDLNPVDDPTAQDSDGDGVTDPFDAYPNDATKAFNTYAPAKNDYGSLVFEDLWPKTGDYDFNDAVVDYNVTQISNASNQLVELQAEFVLKALGGGYHSGFGFTTSLNPSDVQSVSYAWEKNGVAQTGNPPVHYTTNRSSNGTEAGQPKATFIVFDDGYDILEPSLTSRSYYANVVPEEAHKTPGRVTLTIKLTHPMAMTAAGSAPYNPFLIANGLSWGRGVEVHLPGYAPTAKAALNLFGQDQDTSNPLLGRYYVDSSDRPWAMNVPTQFTYIKERLDQPGGSVSLGNNLRDGYKQFDSWIGSAGVNYKDWFRDLSNYRDTTKLFQ